jgi:Tol biopolymer transport system component
LTIEPELIPTQFFFDCSQVSTHLSSLSPDGKWYAAVCGQYKYGQDMIVKDSTGKHWELKFEDHLSSDTGEGISGYLFPVHWSKDGHELYYSTLLGIDGGGNQCFKYGEFFSLFRLNLDTGEITTIIEPENMWTMFNLSFSPNEQFIATDNHGMSLMDPYTGEIKQINDDLAMSFRWSPDGSMLAYSVATCSGEEFIAKTSSVFIYYIETGESKRVMTVDGVVLYVQDWRDNDHFEILKEEIVDYDNVYTNYLYDLTEDEYVPYINTPTPTP